MKRLCLLLLLGLFLVGCGSMGRQSEFWQHDSVYKNWDHMKFSLFGYKSPTAEVAKKSQEQGWWGIEIPHIPEE